MLCASRIHRGDEAGCNETAYQGAGPEGGRTRGTQGADGGEYREFNIATSQRCANKAHPKQ